MERDLLFTFLNMQNGIDASDEFHDTLFVFIAGHLESSNLKKCVFKSCIILQTECLQSIRNFTQSTFLSFKSIFTSEKVSFIFSFQE